MISFSTDGSPDLEISQEKGNMVSLLFYHYLSDARVSLSKLVLGHAFSLLFQCIAKQGQTGMRKGFL